MKLYSHAKAQPRIIGEMRMVLRVCHRLPAYLRTPLTAAECRTMVRQRLEQRETDFLNLMRRAVFNNPNSPYQPLMRLAGREYLDLVKLIHREGLEQTLRMLLREGVYLTVDEFKGRRPLVRGSMTIPCHSDQLRNTLVTPHFLALTSGSRGRPTRIQLDMACIRERAVNMYLALEARGGTNWRNAVWCAGGIAPLLWYSGYGRPADRWFQQADPASFGWHSRLGKSVRLLGWISRLAGVPLPWPEYAPVKNPLPVLRWMEESLAKGAVPHLFVAPSAAVALCQMAEQFGVGLQGARFTVTGEPVTAARLAAIRRAGGDPVPDYGCSETGGSLTCGCLAPEAPDDVHFFGDLHAIIQADATPFPRNALLITSLRDTAPFILLNVSMGDCATVTARRCGCPLEMLGWPIHLQQIRSFEKLTALGVTFEDSEIIPLLEELLPRTFGGGPTDYQLEEEESADGAPCLHLRVRPSVGDVDAEAVAKFFLEEIGKSSEIKRNMAAIWRQTGLLRVVRGEPRETSSGKILHLVAASSESGEQG
jgi:hypothetical protein